METVCLATFLINYIYDADADYGDDGFEKGNDYGGVGDSTQMMKLDKKIINGR